MSSRFQRFVVPARDAESGCAAGIFQIEDHLPLCRADPALARRLREHFEWFNENLRVPKVKPRNARVIFWFRPDAGEPLHRMRQVATWLRTRGINVVTLQTDTPGRFVYSDRHQVGAIPVDGTGTDWLDAAKVLR